MSALATQIDPRPYRRNIPVYYIFMASTGFMIFLPVWIIYLTDHRGMSLTTVGIMESLFWLTIVLAEVPTGAVADRFGRRISLALGGFLFFASMLVFAIADTVPLLLTSYLIMGVSMTLYSGASQALLYDTLRVLGRTNEFERHMGRSEAGSFFFMLLASGLGGPLVALIGYSPTILLSCAFFLMAACTALMLREPPRKESDYLPDPLHAQPASRHDLTQRRHESESGSAGIPVFSEMFHGIRIAWRTRPIRYVILLAALMLAVMQMPEFLAQPYVRSHGIDPAADLAQGAIFSGLMMPAQLGAVIGLFFAASLVGRLGERRAFPTLLLTGGILLVPLILWNHLGLIGVIMLVSAARHAVRPIATGYINRRIPSDQRATVLSVLQLMVGATMALMFVSVVPTADLAGFQSAFGLALAILAGAGFTFWLIWRFAHRRDQSERLQRWSLTIAAPQAASTPTNGANDTNSAGRNHVTQQNSGRSLYPSLQNGESEAQQRDPATHYD